MAVVKRKRANGYIYGVVNEWRGKPVWELVGTSRRDAEIRDRAMKREIKQGTYQIRAEQKAVTVRQFAESWSSGRNNPNAKHERDGLRLYVYPRPWLSDMRLDEVRPKEIDRLIKELKEETRADGRRRLSDKTIYNLVGTLRVMFNDAIRAEVTVVQPVILKRGTLDTTSQKEIEIYTKAEARALTTSEKIPWPIRVLNAICIYGGLREGEACGLKWSEIDPHSKPLGGMTISSQYGGKKLKTKRPRVVPIHRELWAILEAWGRDGFELYTGERPRAEDYVVPNCSPRATARHHTKSSYYLAFRRSAEAAGVRFRSLHATRHTFITICRRAGARAEVLERVTHNARGKIIDRYTHWEWEPLCEVVSLFNLDVHQDLHSGGVNPQDPGGADRPRLPDFLQNADQPGGRRLDDRPASFFEDYDQDPAKSRTRQEIRQEIEWTLVDLKESNRERKRALLLLAALNREAARPGLAFVRALNEAYKGEKANLRAVAVELERAATLLGLKEGSAGSPAKGGAK